MAWAFQLMIRMPGGRSIGDLVEVGPPQEADEKEQAALLFRPEESAGTHQLVTWLLSAPVGRVEVLVANDFLSNPTELTFRGGFFASEADAAAAGRLLSDWLRLAGALEGFGFDFGRDQGVQLPPLGVVLGPMFEQPLADAGVPLVPDVHGLVSYEVSGNAVPFRVQVRGEAVALRSLASVREAVLRAANAEAGVVDDKLTLACDLACLAERESSDRARLLALVTAMEILSTRSEREGASRALVDRFVREAQEASPPASEGLLSALVGLRLTCGVRRIRPPSSAESDQSFRLNPTTQFGVSDHLGEGLAAA